jgi:hypothetical protein
MVERGGFEPPKAEPADLQSAPFGRSGTSPLCCPLFGNRLFGVYPYFPLRNYFSIFVIPSPINDLRIAFNSIPLSDSRFSASNHGAGDGIRTRNLLITNQLLYR